ncbi:hypothetical protein [Agrobacterium tumefaciens]|uniref:hypothetical protein n=1 Tax=Agrobacterium tumefaciens TaxID=358 RepID=UPI0021D2ADCA|nr:hypothetical protein [Agrobacterium tumefaciens]UXS01157.1 hypothetical protein FY156_06460 [Agrobacterium tumefaciens]
MRRLTLAITCVVATAFALPAIAQEPPPRQPGKQVERGPSKKPKLHCKTVLVKAKDRFGRPITKKEKVCR